MAPRRAQSTMGDNNVPNYVPQAAEFREFQEEIRNEFRAFQETMIQTLMAHLPPPPPARGPEPREEDLPPPPPAPAAVRDYLPIVRELRAMHTPRFGGSLDPEAAEEWMTCITRDLEYVHCPLRYRALLASHHLSGQARHWWEKVVQEMPDGYRFTWEEFKEEFERKYYRRQNQECRLSDFLNLQQGNMTVREYEVEFVRMLKHSAHLVPLESQKITKFIVGLRPSLRWRVTLYEFRTLSHCIDQLEKAEEAEKEERASRARDRSPPRRHPYTRLSGKTGQTGQSSRVQDKGKVPVTQTRRAASVSGYATRPAVGAGVAPRVYALEAEQEIQEEKVHDDGVEADAIAGTLHLYGVSCYTLFDTGATHSFVSAAIVERIDVEKVKPMSNFTVRTPAGETLTVRGTLLSVPLDICGRQMPVDLIVVPIGVYDLILGMDWLTKYQAYIDCPQRTIRFQEDFGVVITATKEPEKRLEDTHVARKFSDVFPDELPGIPPKREVDFSIDVIPGTEPITKTPYRMAPTEMAELKKQMNELVENEFIRPSGAKLVLED
ncbi:PREDICTED: uncharacterized protein LOC104801876 [Tarenaya hassleriana]|uniref:uncharacterized protein LOC104801876 n=1 Tax=Tarenaya hassleriana TaxID=28532 RepID=UPI00053C700D|nr:PREDICTED: uncharacterized protein LOC104801876 [Tarenaya hassleriana]